MLFQRLCILILLVLAPAAHATRAIPDDNLAYPVLITLKSGGTGSGFFLHAKKFMYLVTAKHVLIDIPKNTLLSDEASLVSYSNDPKDATPNRIALNLKALHSAGQLIKHPNRDIVIVRLAKIVRGKDIMQLQYIDGVEAKSSSQGGTVGVSLGILKKFDDVLVANEVIVFGYPVSLGLKNHPQLDYERPLLRKGIVAGLNFSQRSIVLDCSSFPGNSGSPVLEVEEEGIGSRKFRIIGVISEFVPSEEIWTNTKYNYSNSTILNSGYSIATPIDFVLELLGDDG
jgi:hypothetical protein